MAALSKTWISRMRQRVFFRCLAGPIVLLVSALFTTVEAGSPPDRWALLDESTVLDTKTGLAWSRNDNGHDVTWPQAAKLCADRPGRWRMPHIEELANIYDATGTQRAPCGGKSMCGVSTLFGLTAEWVWSADAVGKDGSDGDELAWGLLFVNGTRSKSVQYAADRSRALCVRTSSQRVPQTLPAPEEQTLPIDQSHTAVIFSWAHHGYSHPVARLEQVKGTLRWNRLNIRQSFVEVSLPLTGLRTGDDALDRRLRGADFFDAARNPTITFKSTQIIPKTGSSEFELIGELTVNGTTQPVTLQAKINAISDEPGQPTRAGFDADGVLRRSDFGVSRYVPMISDEISIHITLEAHPE
jgi:polyisoprenoid-binding protein YceI